MSHSTLSPEKVDPPVFPSLAVPASAAKCAALPQGAGLILYRELSSAATHAQLSLVAKSWSPEHIELRLTPESQRSKSFYSVTQGGRLQSRHAARIQERYPETDLVTWREHPLGRVLCDPTLTAEQLISALDSLPQGPVRRIIWAIDSEVGGPPALRGSGGLTQALCRIGDATALFALVVRMRLGQLTGDRGIDFDGESGIWSMLPRAMGGCIPLLVAKDTLICAIMHFLAREPFCEIRASFEMQARIVSRLREHQLREVERSWEACDLIPDEIKRQRADRCRELMEDLRRYTRSRPSFGLGAFA